MLTGSKGPIWIYSRTLRMVSAVGPPGSWLYGDERKNDGDCFQIYKKDGRLGKISNGISNMKNTLK